MFIIMETYVIQTTTYRLQSSDLADLHAAVWKSTGGNNDVANQVTNITRDLANGVLCGGRGSRYRGLPVTAINMSSRFVFDWFVMSIAFDVCKHLKVDVDGLTRNYYLYRTLVAGDDEPECEINR